MGEAFACLQEAQSTPQPTLEGPPPPLHVPPGGSIGYSFAYEVFPGNGHDAEDGKVFIRFEAAVAPGSGEGTLPP
jgi:hypothetical protein